MVNEAEMERFSAMRSILDYCAGACLNEATAALVDLTHQLPTHADRLNNVRSILEGLHRKPDSG
jgi:hypothetical protein